MSDRDRELSRRISPPSREAARNAGLRELHVERLDARPKAVGRVSLRQATLSIFCEPCRFWTRLPKDEDFPVEWECARCKRIYEMELAVYSEIPPEEITGSPAAASGPPPA